MCEKETRRKKEEKPEEEGQTQRGGGEIRAGGKEGKEEKKDLKLKGEREGGYEMTVTEKNNEKGAKGWNERKEKKRK